MGSVSDRRGRGTGSVSDRIGRGTRFYIFYYLHTGAHYTQLLGSFPLSWSLEGKSEALLTS